MMVPLTGTKDCVNPSFCQRMYLLFVITTDILTENFASVFTCNGRNSPTPSKLLEKLALPSSACLSHPLTSFHAPFAEKVNPSPRNQSRTSGETINIHDRFDTSFCYQLWGRTRMPRGCSLTEYKGLWFGKRQRSEIRNTFQGQRPHISIDASVSSPPGSPLCIFMLYNWWCRARNHASQTLFSLFKKYGVVALVVP